MTSYRWPLFILFVLIILDAGLTSIGLFFGANELNPMIEHVGYGVFELRMVSAGVFIGLVGLLGEKYPWACGRALWIVLIIMSFVVIWNLIAISDGVWYG